MLDIHSQTIAHFIGLFQITVEKAALRLDYDRFSVTQRDTPPETALPNVQVEVHAPLAPDAFTARLTVAQAGAGAVDGGGGAGRAGAAGQQGAGTGEGASAGAGWVPTGLPAAWVAPGADGTGMEMVIAPPAQFGVVTVQVNLVLDQDVWTTAGFAGSEAWPPLVSPSDFLAQLQGMVALAARLGALPPISAAEGVAPMVATLADAMLTLDPATAPQGADAALLRLTHTDADTGMVSLESGSAFNGQAGAELPDWLTPVLTAREAAAAEAAAAPDPGAPELQEVATGSNLLLNEAHVARDWLDAPVIAVAGSVHDLTAIVQVSLLGDHDMIDAPAATDPQPWLAAADLPGRIGNAATLTLDAQKAWAQAQADARKAEAAAGGKDAVPPQAWAVTRIEGDLLAYDWLAQTNLISDDDVAQFGFGGNGLMAGLGANTLANLSDLVGLGAHFDLILVGGNMVSLALVQQINVLLDDDRISVGAEFTAAPQAIGSVASHGNLLWNEATIDRLGVDYHTALSAGFADTLARMQDGAQDIDSSTARDALFAGYETLRVLYIEGDFVSVDLLTQINVLGDNDQIQAIACAMTEAGLAPLQISAGDNTLANLASLRLHGVDSTVMAAEGAYSDAVIWQAGMLDAGNAALAGTHPLATEAVAFLADGMITPLLPDVPVFTGTEDSGPLTADVMQTVLA